jgi:predicted Zn-dependent protease
VFAREALTLDSVIQDAHGQMARAFDKMGLLDSAAVHAEAEVRLQPGDRTELTRLVSIYQRQKKQASLVQLLEPMMPDSAALSRFGLILVNAYSETNDMTKAKELVQRIITADPSNCDAHQTYAYIMLKRERYGEAIPVLLAGVKACPKDCDMWVRLGDSYYFSNEKSRPAVTNARDAYAKACGLGCKEGCQKKEQVEEILKGPGLSE